MYLHPKLFCLLIFCSFLFTCCEKEALNQQAFTNNGGLLQATCEACGEGCALTSVLEAIKDPNDLNNDRINMMLYHYGKALKQVVKNSTFKQLILDRLTTQTTSATSLLVLAQENAAFAAFFNDQLRQSMSTQEVYPRGVEPGVEALITTPGWDANSYLSERMTHEGYAYHPVVYELKAFNPNNENPLTVLIAQEVNDCNDVAGWRGDTEILMSEAQVDGSEDIILFVGPGKSLALESTPGVQGQNSTEELTEIATPTLSKGMAQERTITADFQLKVKTGKIKGLKYRYEKTGKSEIVAFAIGWNDVPFGEILRSNKEAYHQFKKSEISGQKVVTMNRSIGGLLDNPFNNNVFLGFYEYDWYIKNKNLKEIKCPCNSSINNARLSMKYAHEWYNIDKFCGLIETVIPGQNGSKTIDNYKGTFVLQRQPL